MNQSNKYNFTVWDLPQDAIVRFGQGVVIDLALSDDGMYLAVGTCAGVWVYDLTTCTPIALLETERGMINTVTLCSTQSRLALKNTDKYGKEVIKIWDLNKHQRLATMEYPSRLKNDPSKNDLCSLCFSPSGEWLAASRYSSSVIDIWEATTGKLHTELSSEENGLCSPINGFNWDFSGALVFSPDNRLFLSSNKTDFITVWDTTTFQQIIQLTGHPEGVHSLSFSPNGQFLAAGGVKGTVQEWNTSAWQIHKTYPSFGNFLMDVSYAPDGTLRAAGTSYDECAVAVWDVEQRKKRYTFEGWEIYPRSFSHGTRLALKSEFEVQVKTVGDTESLSILPWEQGDLHSLVFSPDGKTLVAGHRQFGGTILWDVTTHRPQRVISEPRCETSTVFAYPSTEKLYAIGYPPGESDYWSNTLNLWEIGQSEPIAELTIPGELPNRRAMAYSPITNLLVCGNGTDAKDWSENDSENGAVYIWDVEHAKMHHIFRNKHTNSINYVKLSPDGTRLISIDTDCTYRVWDVMCGEEIGKFPEYFMMNGVDYEHYDALSKRFEEVTSFQLQVFSPCGKLIAGGLSDDRILVWDIEQGEARMTIHKPLAVPNDDTSIASVDPIEFSPCGKYLAYGENWEPGIEKVPVRSWEIDTGENIATFRGHPTDIQCLAFSPDSTILASGSFDGTILLWDMKPYL